MVPSSSASEANTPAKHRRIAVQKRRRRALYAVLHGLHLKCSGVRIELADGILNVADQRIRTLFCANDQIEEQTPLGFHRRVDGRARRRIQRPFLDIAHYSDDLAGLLSRRIGKPYLLLERIKAGHELVRQGFIDDDALRAPWDCQPQ